MARIALIVLCGLLPLIQARMQSVGVRGTLKCGNKPLAKTVVKLWDLDTLDPDDVLGCVHTDAQGNFEVQGHESEITDLDPVLKIYTNCNDATLWGAAPKAQEAGEIVVAKMVEESHRRQLDVETHQMANLLCKQASGDIGISVHGFFILTKEIILTIYSFIITYVVILLQSPSNPSTDPASAKNNTKN